MDRRTFCLTAGMAALAGAAGVPMARAAGRAKVEVYRTAGCSCCMGWARHVMRAGFDVTVKTVEEIAKVKARGGVPEALWSCHTAFVDGYVIEGHVPAREIAKLLRERPKAKGLAVPGMPVGSPGMEMGGRVDRYEVILFGAGGRRVYATYGS